MTNLLSGVAFGALLLASASAYAADPAAPLVDEVAAASAFSGNVEFGGIVRHAAEFDDGDLEEEATIGGAYGAFALWGQFDNLRLGIDGYVEGMAFDDIAEDNTTTPRGLGALGAHVGLDLGSGYVGAFGALGVYPERDNEKGVTGVAGGIEGLAQLDAVTLFGKAGYAFAPSEEYEDDYHEGFVGPFVEAGAIYALSDDLAVLAKVGYGNSADFDQPGTDGYYASWGAKLAYRLPTDLNLNLVASYDGYRVLMDNGDEQVEHTFKLGLSIPFGDNGTAASALNPLATTVTPFRAGYSADAL